MYLLHNLALISTFSIEKGQIVTTENCQLTNSICGLKLPLNFIIFLFWILIKRSESDLRSCEET